MYFVCFPRLESLYSLVLAKIILKYSYSIYRRIFLPSRHENITNYYAGSWERDELFLIGSRRSKRYISYGLKTVKISRYRAINTILQQADLFIPNAGLEK